MAWLILKTEPAKEQRVIINLQGIFECYCPMEVRHYRQGVFRTRTTKETPILPRMVFLYTPYSWGLVDIIGHEYCSGIVKDPTMDPTDASRPPYVMSDLAMCAFQCAVHEWLYEARMAYERKEAPPPKPEIVHSLEDMGKRWKEREGIEGLEILEEAA